MVALLVDMSCGGGGVCDRVFSEPVVVRWPAAAAVVGVVVVSAAVATAAAPAMSSLSLGKKNRERVLVDRGVTAGSVEGTG
jgi:hypothetical protein